jgi:hypothetical protein
MEAKRETIRRLGAIAEEAFDKRRSEHTLRMRRKGNRLGIFVTLFSLILLFVGIVGGAGSYNSPTWATFLAAVGLAGTLFGYLMARLWYWFKAA